MKELRDIRGPRPPSDDELEQAKASLVQSLPASFASVNGVNGSIASIYTQGLPEDYYQQFARAVNAVTKEDVVRVAQKYIDPEHLAIVIVGDRDEDRGAARPRRRSRRSCDSTSTAIRSPTGFDREMVAMLRGGLSFSLRRLDLSHRRGQCCEDHLYRELDDCASSPVPEWAPRRRHSSSPPVFKH